MTINIADLNDNAPSIISSSYIAGVLENLPSGQSVLRVSTKGRIFVWHTKLFAALERVVLDPFNLYLALFSIFVARVIRLTEMDVLFSRLKGS